MPDPGGDPLADPGGHLVVEARIDRRLRRAYRRALIGCLGRQARAGITGGTLLIAVGILASWWLLVLLGGGVLLWTARWARERLSIESRVVSGEVVRAGFGPEHIRFEEGSLVTEMAYAEVTRIVPEGAAVQLDLAVGGHCHHPAALFTDEALAWTRARLGPRDVASGPRAAVSRLLEVPRGTGLRLAHLGWRRRTGRWVSTTAVLVVALVVLPGVTPPIRGLAAVLLAAAVFAECTRQLVRQRRSCRLLFPDGGAARVTRIGDRVEIDLPVLRDVVDLRAVEGVDRADAFTAIRHRTAGCPMTLVIPTAWEAAFLGGELGHTSGT